MGCCLLRYFNGQASDTGKKQEATGRLSARVAGERDQFFVAGFGKVFCSLSVGRGSPDCGQMKGGSKSKWFLGRLS